MTPRRPNLDDPALYEGLEDEEARRDRRRLLALLADQGADADLLKAAAREDRLATLPLEFALSGGRRYTLTEVSRRAKVDTKYLRELVLALGFPNPRRGERLFSDEDVEVATLLRRFLDVGLPRDGVLDVARVLGQSMARTAASIRLLAGDALIQRGDTELTLALRYARAAEQLAPLLVPVLAQQLKLHLREQATSAVITHADMAAGRLRGEAPTAVAFADLSDFTRLGERLGPDNIGAIATRMASLAAQLARPPVELVKTIGDGVMLVAPEPKPLLATMVDLGRRIEREGEDFPAYRAGMAFGRAVSRGGDWYGPAVNRAARIVDVAKPGTILVEEAVCEAAGDGYAFKRRRKKSLKGIEGRVRLFRLDLAAA